MKSSHGDLWSESPNIYYVGDRDHVLKIGADPVELASELGDGLDNVSVAEFAAIGFLLDNRTIFKHVKRLFPWETLASQGDSCKVEILNTPSPPACILEFLAEHTCTAFRQGAILELSAGLDSRLLLATATSRNVKPNAAFTLGDDSSPDVLTAAAIAEKLGFKHYRVPLIVNKDRVKYDTLKVVRHVGYSLNAVEFGWMPGTLSKLDSIRSVQVSGVGGEMVGGFYYTPFDPIIESFNLVDRWIKSRLFLPWIEWCRLWDQDAICDVEAALLRDVRLELNRTNGAWRERLDALYRNGRVGQGGIPVLDASRMYYKVVAPYLSPEYVGWALSLPIERRADRLAQRDLLRLSHAQLAGFTRSGQSLSTWKLGSKLKKTARRLLRHRRPSTFGMSQTAIALVQDEQIRGYIWTMAEESNLKLDPQGIRTVLNQPVQHPELLGVLITLGVGWHDLKQRAGAIRSQQTGPSEQYGAL